MGYKKLVKKLLREWVWNDKWKWVFCVRKTEPVIILSEYFEIDFKNSLSQITNLTLALIKNGLNWAQWNTPICYTVNSYSISQEESNDWLLSKEYLGNDSKKKNI